MKKTVGKVELAEQLHKMHPELNKKETRQLLEDLSLIIMHRASQGCIVRLNAGFGSFRLEKAKHRIVTMPNGLQTEVKHYHIKFRPGQSFKQMAEKIDFEEEID